MERLIKRFQYWRYWFGRMMVLDRQFEDFEAVVTAKFTELERHIEHLERMIEHERSIRS